MPTNLPPEYFEAEKRYKEASGEHEKVSALEELISTVPKHKGTDRLRADLRKRLSKLREEGLRKKKSGGRDLTSVEKQGAAQIALVGFANAGKSSLLESLTHARPMIADYPMTTVMPLAGMMPYEDIQFQLVDLPPIGNDSTDGWVSGILRVADLLLLVVDLSEDPEIQLELLMDQLKAWRIPILIKDEISGTARGIKPKPTIIAATRSEMPGTEKEWNRFRNKHAPSFPMEAVSNTGKLGLERLKQVLFENSRIIRVYSREAGKGGKPGEPFTLPRGSTVLDLAEQIHKDFVKNLNYGCIWGSGKFDGQRVQKDYALHDRDIIELHMK